MLVGRRPSRHPLHPALRTLAAGGRQWARGAGQVVVCRLLGGLFLLVLLFSRAIMSPRMLHPVSRTSNESVDTPQKVMIITLEFKKNTFSGNGVYAQSIARSLARRGHEVLVLSAKPVQPHLSFAPTVSSGLRSEGPGIGEEENGVIKFQTSKINGICPQLEEASFNEEQNKTETVMQERRAIPLQKDPDSGLIDLEVEVEREGWGRLDWKCPWQSFARGITGDLVWQVVEFKPSWILVVDWSALPAFSCVAQAVGERRWPMAFLNFRIYYLSEYNGDNGEKEKQFYKEMESQAVSMASAVAALSSRDAQILLTELGAGISPGVVPMPLFPPLREDILTLALARRYDEHDESTKRWLKGRKFFTCCVRLSPEKNAELFASLVEILAAFLQERGIVPFLCGGAHGEGAYAGRIKSRLKAIMPQSVIHEGFMEPSQLSELYSQTLLNVHPCVYDAYGMTIVEAAAFASPSVLHVGPGGAVGAAEFMDPNLRQVLALDLTASIASVGIAIKDMLLDKKLLAQVGYAASRRSLSWNEDANAEQLVSILKSAPPLISQLRD